MGKLRKFRALVAIVAVVAVFVAGQTPASAGDGIVLHGKDYTGIYVDKSQAFICDMESDGHWVKASFYSYSEGKMSEKDGGDYGCDEINLPDDVYKIRLCEENKSCNSEKY